MGIFPYTFIVRDIPLGVSDPDLYQRPTITTRLQTSHQKQMPEGIPKSVGKGNGQITKYVDIYRAEDKGRGRRENDSPSDRQILVLFWDGKERSR